MAKKTNADDQTLEMIALVKKQQDEITQAERPNFITNMLFSYLERPSDGVNLNVESNIRNLICYASYLIEKTKTYNEASTQLGVTDPPQFTWCGFTFQDWLHDIRLRIGKIQIAVKKKKLEALKERLNLIISPELKRQMELEAIKKELE